MFISLASINHNLLLNMAEIFIDFYTSFKDSSWVAISLNLYETLT